MPQPTHLTPEPPPAWVLSRDNEFTTRALLDYTPLPAPTLVGRPDAVYVTVADVDDLALWLGALGGTVHVSDPFEGLRMWVLHTRITRTNGSTVPVRVSAAAVADEPVLAEIRKAVAA